MIGGARIARRGEGIADFWCRQETRVDISEVANGPTDDEVPFDFEELFFSRTDEHGIILSGNSVFQRVSGYSWDELLEKPHKIIRHPDTPRAVFWLLWDTIKRGEAVGAYVKNRAKDGRCYWVFATVMPIEGGYLSVRLKPGSELLAEVKRQYGEIELAERRDGLAPSESAALLLRNLAKLGFNDYGAFMAAALSKEISCRDRQIRRSPDAKLALFDQLGEAAGALLRRASSISDAHLENAFISMNFQVLSARLGDEGAAIRVVSKNYDTISEELNEAVSRFTASAAQVRKAVSEGLFLTGTARMQQEMLAAFKAEAKSDQQSSEHEILLLEAQQKAFAYGGQAIASLEAINRQVEGFRQDWLGMKRLGTGLQVTRIMGKVECARLDGSENGFDALLNDLETFQQTIAAGLRDIEVSNQRIKLDTDSLLAASRAEFSQAGGQASACVENQPSLAAPLQDRSVVRRSA